MKPLARETEKLGESLPMLSREFEILEMVPVAKRGKKTRTPEELRAQAERAERRKKKADAGEVPDPDDDDDDEDGDGDRGEDENPRGEDNEDENAGRDEDRFAISISSEYPVERWFGKEILDHSPDSIDLSRAKRGLSFLDSHDAKSVIGIVDKVKVGDDKKLRGQVRFSRSAPAQQIKTDIQDGIRRFISVGYMVNEYTLDKSSKEEGDTYRATKWTPLEASSVGVPADPTVGNDRKAGDRQYPVLVRNANPASEPNLKEVTVEPVTATQQVAESRAAAAEIIRLGKVHGIDQERTALAVADGMTVGAFSSLVLEEVAKRGGKPLTQPPAENQDRLELTEKEQKQYNVARGIMTAVKNIEAASGGTASKRENSFEMEISETIEKDWKGARHGGLFVPWSLRHAWNPELAEKYGPVAQKRAGLSTNVATAGQELKFTEPGEFIQFLYNQTRLKQLGARTIAGLKDNVGYPKQTGKATGAWVGENPGVDVADSALALGLIASSPKTYQSSSSYSRQLLAQAVVDVDTLVREDLGRDMALAVDAAGILGGGANQPVGIGATAGVQSYVVIADAGNGGAPAWDDVVNMTKLLETANADQLGEGAWLTSPACKAKLKRIGKLNNTIALPIWADDNTVDGYRAASTNIVASNGTKGTGTNLSTLIRGVFETMIISMWGSGFEIVVDPYRLKKQGMIELTTFMLTDIVLRYPQAFVVATDVITT
jgi:HK97 family phage major capsid protein